MQGIFLVQLTVLSNLETQVFLVVKSLSRHNGLWAESVGNSSLHWEEIELLDSIEHNVYHQALEFIETVSCGKQLSFIPSLPRFVI
jgi:hypothetical protein